MGIYVPRSDSKSKPRKDQASLNTNYHQLSMNYRKCFRDFLNTDWHECLLTIIRLIWSIRCEMRKHIMNLIDRMREAMMRVFLELRFNLRKNSWIIHGNWLHYGRRPQFALCRRQNILSHQY